MTTQLTRRSILKALGIGTAALALEPILEPVAKKIWFVPSTAPVGSRIEAWPTNSLDRYVARTFQLSLEIAEEDDPRFNDILRAARAQKRAIWLQQERDFAEIHGIIIDEVVPFSAEDCSALQKPGRLRLPSIQTETTVDVVDLNEGSEWSFENGTRIRFGKGSRAYAARDMELADNYVRNLKIASGLPTIEISSLNDLVFSKS
jgi:hypothetical protein